MLSSGLLHPPYICHKKNMKQKRQTRKHFIILLSLLITGTAVAISGLIIQIHYHVGHHPDASSVLFMNRTVWYTIHVWTSVAFLFATIFHVLTYTKWYKNMFRYRPSPRNRPTLILTFLMIVVTLSGLIPLLISFFDSNSLLRFTIVEIHDKIAILFLILAFFHVKKRLK